MSSQITEENAPGIYSSQSHNENLNTVQSSINDVIISTSKKTEVESTKNSWKMGSSDNLRKKDSKNVEVISDTLGDEILYGEMGNDRCLDENLVLKVSQLDISSDENIVVESEKKEGTTYEEAMAEILGRKDLDNQSDKPLSEQSLKMVGLRLGAETDEESSDESGSESEDFEFENVEEIEIKKRKVHEENTWLQELGVDQVSTEVPQISTLELNNKEEFIHMGDLECVIDKIVTIAGLGGMPAYDIDTLLFIDKGQRILGYVIDVMGPVTAPVYIIPMYSSQAIDDLQLRRGTKVYCAPNTKYTKYVKVQELMKMKGSDPSSTRDTETSSECLELSDEEEGHVDVENTKDKKRMCSLERHRIFVKTMNKANERNTKLHKMADSQRIQLEQLAGVQCFSRRFGNFRNRSQASGNNKHSEGRQSRPLFRHNEQELNWIASNVAAGVAAGVSPHRLVVIPPFDPSTPPPNCSSSRFYIQADENLYSTYLSFPSTTSVGTASIGFERSISRSNVRQNNMPGPSNESLFN